MAVCSLQSYNTILNKNNRTLDLVLSNATTTSVVSEVPLLPPDSHHPVLGVTIFLKSRPKNIQPETPSSTYNFTKADFFGLYKHLQAVDWNSLTALTNVNECLDSFYETFHNSLAEFVPKTSRKPCKFPPWFNVELINLTKERRKLEKKRYYNFENNSNYIAFRSALHLKIKQHYVKFFKDLEFQLEADPKSFFRYLNSKKQNHSSLSYSGNVLASKPSHSR